MAKSTPLLVFLSTVVTCGVGCVEDKAIATRDAQSSAPLSDSPSETDTGPETETEPQDTGEPDSGDAPEPEESVADTGGEDMSIDTGTAPEPEASREWPEGTDPFADAIVSFEPGPDAGFGAELMPDIVLGSPLGGGTGAGSLHVLSLGESGSVVLEMNDLMIVDGPGPDLIVFENAFGGWLETGIVSASEDGEIWHTWPCAATDPEGGFPGCAGVSPVYASVELDVDATNPDTAGGDAFDLADLEISTARFVMIQDSGANTHAYGGVTGGFDLDAIAAANWESIEADTGL